MGQLCHMHTVGVQHHGCIGAKKDGTREGRKHQNTESDHFLSSLVPYTSWRVLPWRMGSPGPAAGGTEWGSSLQFYPPCWTSCHQVQREVLKRLGLPQPWEACPLAQPPAHFLTQASCHDILAKLLTDTTGRQKGVSTHATQQSLCHLRPCPQCAPAKSQPCSLSHLWPTAASPAVFTPLQADAHSVEAPSSATTGTCLRPTQMYYHTAFTPATYSAGVLQSH